MTKKSIILRSLEDRTFTFLIKNGGYLIIKTVAR